MYNNENLLKEAISYLEKGFSVIPICGKRPVIQSWREFQSRRPSKEEITQWFFDNNNITGIAVITGEISGIAILDIEKDADWSKLKSIPETPTAISGGGGKHYYFKYPKDRKIASENLRKINIEGDFKADGGYVVLPPSRHESGNQYEWLINLAEKDFAKIPEWLIEKNNQTKSAKAPEEWKRIFQGVSEGERHNNAVSVAGKFLRNFPSYEWEYVVWPALEGWNLKNNPPLSDKELRNIFDGIAKKEKESRTNNESGENQYISVMSLGELLEKSIPEDLFLVDKLIPRKGITVLSGHPGCGKSWTMLSIAEAVASGNALFGQYKTEQGGVLIIDGENGDAELQRRVKLLNSQKDLPVFFAIQQSFKADNDEKVKQILEIAEERDVKLIIIDPFAAIHSLTENNAEDMQKVMEQLQKFTQAEISVLCLHHHRKNIGYKKQDASQSLRGSSAFSARVDSHLAVNLQGKIDNDIKLLITHEKSRRGKQTEPFNILIKQEGEDGKITLIYEKADLPKLKKEEAEEIIIEILKDENMLDIKEISERLKKEIEIGDRYIKSTIKELENKDVIRYEKDGKKKRYFLAKKENNNEDMQSDQFDELGDTVDM